MPSKKIKTVAKTSLHQEQAYKDADFEIGQAVPGQLPWTRHVGIKHG